VVPLEEPLIDKAAVRRKKGLETKETVCEVMREKIIMRSCLNVIDRSMYIERTTTSKIQ
jgi:hypothetical protein